MKVQVEIPTRWRRSVPTFLAPILALLIVAACGDATPLQDFRDSNAMIMGMLTGKLGPDPDRKYRTSASGEKEEERLVCPLPELREGTTYYSFYAPKKPTDAKNLRYQATISRTARECDFQPDYIAIKVGFAGRVLVGPVGGPGQVMLPIRVDFAGKGDAIVWSKTYKVPVSIPPDVGSQFYAHVVDDLVYQLRYGQKLSDFRIYVSFDTVESRALAKPVASLR